MNISHKYININKARQGFIYFGEKIDNKSSKDYFFLSPYFIAPFKIKQISYPTVLHYYYATKFEAFKQIYEKMMCAYTAMEVYKTAKNFSMIFKQSQVSKQWKSIRIEVMKLGVTEKFNQNPVLLNKLKSTGNCVLAYIHGKSRFWGSSLPQSQNILGKLLMEIRESISFPSKKVMLDPLSKTNYKKEGALNNIFDLNSSADKAIKNLNIMIQNSSLQIGGSNQKSTLNTILSKELIPESISSKFNIFEAKEKNSDENITQNKFSNSKGLKEFQGNKEILMNKFSITKKEKLGENALNQIIDPKLPQSSNSRNQLSNIPSSQEQKIHKIVSSSEQKDEEEKKINPNKGRLRRSSTRDLNADEIKKLVSNKSSEDKMKISLLLAETSPFMYLAQYERQLLVEEGYLFSFQKQFFLSEADTPDNKNCFILLEGEIHVQNEKDYFLEKLESHSFFGIDGPLFEFRFTKFKAIKDTIIFVIPQNALYKVLKPFTMFSIYIARNLMQKQNVLAPIMELKKFYRQTVLQDSINIPTMLEHYKKINSSLHPKCNSSEIDTDSWLYAIRRLPNNLCTTFSFLVTFSKIPDLLTHAKLKKVTSSMRARTIFEIMPGKNLIILREMETDLMDFLANMCIHLVESLKLCSKINSPNSFRDLQQPISEAETLATLKAIGFSENEINGLRKIWPKNLAEYIVKLIMHRNNYLIQVRNPTSNIKHDPIEKWTIRLWRSTVNLLNLPSTTLCCDIPDKDLCVDIIQGSRRGFLGVISPYIFKNRNKIIEWAEKFKPKVITKQFLCEEDRLMAYSYHYFKEFPEEEKDRVLLEEECGIMRVDEMDFTGICFVLVDAKKLNPEWIDPKIKLNFNSKYHLIINIGYTFGAQSSDIMRAIVVVYGRKMKTLNIIGKAGGFVGKKGDILVATKIISEENMEVVNNFTGDFSRKKLETEVCTSVHMGPMLTVGGTILQNTILLNFYEKLFGCVGLEMEGLYYSKELKKFSKLGWIREGLICLFAYYISDLPKDPNSNLSQEEGNISFDEGVPSMNAIYRHFIARMFI